MSKPLIFIALISLISAQQTSDGTPEKRFGLNYGAERYWVRDEADTQKFKDAQGRYNEKDVVIEPADNLLVFGNGRIVDEKYELQPIKTRPMMPATYIHGVEDLKKALKQLQSH